MRGLMEQSERYRRKNFDNLKDVFLFSIFGGDLDLLDFVEEHLYPMDIYKFGDLRDLKEAELMAAVCATDAQKKRFIDALETMALRLH